MAVMLTFDLLGERQVRRRLEQFSVLVNSAEPAWLAIAEDFLRLERRQFGSEGEAGSGGWAPLSPAYGAWKAVRYPDSPLLQKSGALVNSLTWAGAPGQVRDITPFSVTLGTSVPYARLHQDGTPTMPQRRPIELTEADKVRWVEILQAWIVGNAR